MYDTHIKYRHETCINDHLCDIIKCQIHQIIKKIKFSKYELRVWLKTMISKFLIISKKVLYACIISYNTEYLSTINYCTCKNTLTRVYSKNINRTKRTSM